MVVEVQDTVRQAAEEGADPFLALLVPLFIVAFAAYYYVAERHDASSFSTTLSRTDPIWVRFALSEAEFARLRARETAAPEVKLEMADGSAYSETGKLNFASSTVDANLGTVQMRAEFPNANLKVLPGQYVRVQVIAGTQQAIVVPQSAVQQNESGRFVWIASDEGKAAIRNIRAGNWIGKDWVVLEGLRPGDKVITDNLVRLRPGSAVAAK